MRVMSAVTAMPVPRYAPRAATARPHRRPCDAHYRAAGRSYVAADQRFFDAHVGRPFGHRQWELATFSATAAHLIPGEVAGDVIDAVERLEQIAGQHDVLHQLGHLAVADHMAPAGRKGKVLEHRLTAEGPARIDAELDVADQILESDAGLSRRDIRVRHAHDRGMAEGNRAGVAGRPFAEFRRRLPGVQAADEDAFADEWRILRGTAFVVERQCAS